jgi:hypothetical protein
MRNWAKLDQHNVNNGRPAFALSCSDFEASARPSNLNDINVREKHKTVILASIE